MHIKYFDEYVSLGDNCEAGLNFFRIGYDYGSIFRFSSTPFDSLLRVLESNFVGLYDEVEPIANNMVRCIRYEIAFHTKLHSYEIYGRRQYLKDLDVKSIHADDILKLRYLVNKFKLERSNKIPILYILKNKNNISDIALLKLKVLLDRYGEGSEILLLGENCLPRQVSNGIYIRSVDYFAPFNKALAFDINSWDKIFHEFPLIAGKRGLNPIKSKIEI